MTSFGLMGNTSPWTSQDVIMSRKWVNHFHNFTEGSWAIPYPKEKSEVDLGFQAWSTTALKKGEKKEEGSKNNDWPFSTLHKMKEKNKHTHCTHKTIKYLAPLWKFKPYVQLKNTLLSLILLFWWVFKITSWTISLSLLLLLILCTDDRRASSNKHRSLPDL